jgi:hypothetical protein
MWYEPGARVSWAPWRVSPGASKWIAVELSPPPAPAAVLAGVHLVPRRSEDDGLAPPEVPTKAQPIKTSAARY